MHAARSNRIHNPSPHQMVWTTKASPNRWQRVTTLGKAASQFQLVAFTTSMTEKNPIEESWISVNIVEPRNGNRVTAGASKIWRWSNSSLGWPEKCRSFVACSGLVCVIGAGKMFETRFDSDITGADQISVQSKRRDDWDLYPLRLDDGQYPSQWTPVELKYCALQSFPVIQQSAIILTTEKTSPKTWKICITSEVPRQICTDSSTDWARNWISVQSSC